MEVSGTGIAKDEFSVMTKPGEGIDLRNFRDPHPVPHEYRTYGATFEHVVQDVKLVTGTVRDLATGLPVPGVQSLYWDRYIPTHLPMPMASMSWLVWLSLSVTTLPPGPGGSAARSLL